MVDTTPDQERQEQQNRNKEPRANCRNPLFLYGKPAGARTRDPLINSQLLYQLSYGLTQLQSENLRLNRISVNKQLVFSC